MAARAPRSTRVPLSEGSDWLAPGPICSWGLGLVSQADTDGATFIEVDFCPLKVSRDPSYVKVPVGKKTHMSKVSLVCSYGTKKWGPQSFSRREAKEN